MDKSSYQHIYDEQNRLMTLEKQQTDGVFNYTDSDDKYHIINVEGVLEWIYGAKVNIDIFWE